MRLVGAALVLACVAALGACGGPSADLYLVERTGSTPGARLTMLLGDGGTVTCNRGPERQITSAQLIDAREIAGDLNGDEEEPGPAARGVRLPPGPGSILRYRVRSEEGAVAFSDTSRGQPPVFYRLAQFTRRLSKEVCGLPR